MKSSGNFILMNRAEFHDWVFSTVFHRKISLLQQHHTWKPNYDSFTGNNHFELLESMKNYHVNTNGFADIAQNLTIFPDGLIAVCRPFDIAPAGIRGANSEGLCIENIGNFDVGGDTMSDEHRKSVIYATAILCMRFELEPGTDTITYHHWWNLDGWRFSDEQINSGSLDNVKTCPGSAFFGGNTVAKAQEHFIPLILQQRSFEWGLSSSDPTGNAKTDPENYDEKYNNLLHQYYSFREELLAVQDQLGKVLSKYI